MTFANSSLVMTSAAMLASVVDAVAMTNSDFILHVAVFLAIYFRLSGGLFVVLSTFLAHILGFILRSPNSDYKKCQPLNCEFEP